jgi:hypothetical protein
MKKIALTLGIVVASIITLSSLTFNQANSKSGYRPQVQFTIPVAPKSTIITKEINVVFKYLNKGYQVQHAWSNNGWNYYVVVKY